MVMETINSTKRKSAKEHTCNYCGFPITKGTVYDRQVNKSDGRVYTFISHESCTDLACKIITEYSIDDGLTHDDFMIVVEDEYQNLYIDTCKKEEKLSNSQIFDKYLKENTPFEAKLEMVKKKFLKQIII